MKKIIMFMIMTVLSLPLTISADKKNEVNQTDVLDTGLETAPSAIENSKMYKQKAVLNIKNKNSLTVNSQDGANHPISNIQKGSDFPQISAGNNKKSNNNLSISSKTGAKSDQFSVQDIKEDSFNKDVKVTSGKSMEISSGIHPKVTVTKNDGVRSPKKEEVKNIAISLKVGNTRK